MSVRLRPGKRIIEEPPPSVRARRPVVSAEVDALVGAMLAKDPARRPATAREVASRLDAALRSVGGVDLARFLEEHFPDEREITADPVAAHVEPPPVAVEPAEPAPAPIVEAVPAPPEEPAPVRAPRRARRPTRSGAAAEPAPTRPESAIPSWRWE